MRMKRFFQALTSAVLIMLGAATLINPAHAQNFDYIEALQLNTNDGSIRNRYGNVGDVINTFVRPAFIIAGFIFFLTIVINGVRMAFSPGNKQVLENAKKYITYSLIGLVIIFSAFWIVEIVQMITGVNAPI